MGYSCVNPCLFIQDHTVYIAHTALELAVMCVSKCTWSLLTYVIGCDNWLAKKKLLNGNHRKITMLFISYPLVFSFFISCFVFIFLKTFICIGVLLTCVSVHCMRALYVYL